MISVVIPVKDGGLDLVRCLEAILRQQVDEDVEVVVVDSGSSDGSAERARGLGARVHEILPEEFTHGGARNLGAELARGDVIVFTSQDAYAVDERWLAALVAPLRESATVAGVYGRQLPHEEAIPSERYFLDFLYGPEARRQRLTDPDRLSFQATLFSNVNSAVPRAVLERYPLAADVIMSEDQEWSRRVLLAGLEIVYEPRAAVRHSHAYTIAGAFRRFFDSGVSADRAYVSEAPSSRLALREAGFRYALGEIAWLWRTGRRRWLPYAAVYESAKFAGLQLGLRHRRIPVPVKRRLSGLSAHWGEGASPSRSQKSSKPRVCLVYDHLFPQTVGGAERWMRDLALHVAATGHDVTYVTMRHWDEAERPNLAGVRVLGLTPAGRVYRRERRTLMPPVRFGLAVARHLWRHGSEYDIVHMASFPYFPLLAASAIGRRRKYALVVNWLEIWTKEYWRRYAGVSIGTIGWLVQQTCVVMPHTAYCFSRLHAERLLEAGYSGTPVLLPGLYAGPVHAAPVAEVDPALVVYAGRHVQEKRVGHLVRAFARARERNPQLRLELYGDGPERAHVEELARTLELDSSVLHHGRRPEDEVTDAIARAACLVTASEREGYGLVVVEAAAQGTPSVVVAGPENAATELVRDGVNGAVAPDVSPDSLASAIERVLEAGPTLRKSTATWFAENARTLKIDTSLELVVEGYAQVLTRVPSTRE
ncbi:MAG: glycosyltransferase [Actinobacteria bacterium]|nr:glycosyltransferase [Actinomycetota bacterium]